MVKVLKCKSIVYKNLCLLLLFVVIIIIITIIIIIIIIIINYKSRVVEYSLNCAFSIYFYLFIYFWHLYIDHHLANIARIGTAVVKARRDGRDHKQAW